MKQCRCFRLSRGQPGTAVYWNLALVGVDPQLLIERDHRGTSHCSHISSISSTRISRSINRPLTLFQSQQRKSAFHSRLQATPSVSR